MNQIITAQYSSLKHFNFKGWTADQIVQKYENVLTSRENQITDLTIEIGSLNDKLDALIEKCDAYEKENEQLKIKLQKKENLLNQEQNNKEIMFMRLEKKENEYDNLKKQYDLLIQRGNMPMKQNPFVNPYAAKMQTMNTYNYPTNIMVQQNIQRVTNENSSQENKVTIDEKQIKTSARNKIKELKTKNTNLSKINFAQLMEYKESQKEEKKEEKTKEE